MLSAELIYEISVFLSPKDLVRFSLCSKYLRSTVLENQRIWRFQYYKEWPAFFTPHHSDRDILFPAPTWIQTFLMRKLAELNVKKGKKRQINCSHEYKVFHDLILCQDKSNSSIAVYKDLNQKIVEYHGIEDFNLYRSVISYNKYFIVCSGIRRIYYLSRTGHCAWQSSGMVFDLCSIDTCSFFGSNLFNTSKFTITAENKMVKQKLDFSDNSMAARIYGSPGCCITAEFGKQNMHAFVWIVWDIRTPQPKLVTMKEFIAECRITRISKSYLATAEFIFVPFVKNDTVFVYVYSFEEDGFRVFTVNEEIFLSECVVFHATEKNHKASYQIVSGLSALLCVFFSGETLDTMTFTSIVKKCVIPRFIQITKELMLFSSFNTYQGKLCIDFSIIDMKSGTVLWCEEVNSNNYKIDGNSRYITVGDVVYDFSPERPPVVKEWVYMLFE